MRKRKDFLVIAEDEPYFMAAYGLIRENEISKGTWSDEDERIYQAAQHRVEPTICPACFMGAHIEYHARDCEFNT